GPSRGERAVRAWPASKQNHAVLVRHRPDRPGGQEFVAHTYRAWRTNQHRVRRMTAAHRKIALPPRRCRPRTNRANARAQATMLLLSRQSIARHLRELFR